MPTGVIAHLPNEAPRFIPISTELLGCCLHEVSKLVRRAVCSAFDVEEDEDLRLTFKERDLEDERSASAFVKSMASGFPCAVRVLFRLLGGKGGFGSLLRSQKGGKKTTNFGAMRDLTGRRLRHSQAVDKIKDWIEKNKKDDELVDMLTPSGPEVQKPTPEADTLDPEFLRKLKRASAERPAVVSMGLKHLEASSDGDMCAIESSGKRTKLDDQASSADHLGSFDALGTLSSPSSPGSDAEPQGSSCGPMDGGECKAAASSSAGGIDASAAGASVASVASASTAAPGGPTEFAFPEGHAPRVMRGGFSASSSGSDGRTFTQAPPPRDEGASRPIADNGDKLDIKELSSAASAAQLDQTIISEPSNATKARGNRGNKPATESTTAKDDAEVITAADLVRYATARELEESVSPDTLKRSLTLLGLKCGGAAKDRAERLFLLKGKDLKDLPKSAFAPKTSKAT